VPVAPRSEIVESLAELELFAELTRPQLESVALSFEEEVSSAGQRVLRQGLSGSGFFIILEGEASIRVNGEDRWTLARGDFFGEVSVLTGGPPTADVIARSLLRTIVVPGPELKEFLIVRPTVTYRLLETEAERLRAALAWRA
jgi:CRP/FNR family transcriptional regulator, cyclic AMP receptor protein